MAVGTGMQAGQRRLLYGLNVVVSVVVALGIFVLVLLLAGRFRTQVDLTSTRVNSLSSRTVQLLRDLPEPITITALYAVPSEYVEVDKRRQDAVRDYLSTARLYVEAGDRKSVVEGKRVAAGVGRGKPAYVEDAAPHRAALAEFTAFNQRLLDTTTAGVERLVELARAHEALNRSREFTIVGTNLNNLKAEGESVTRRIAEAVEGTLPRYERAVGAVRDYLSTARLYVEDGRGWLTGQIGRRPDLPTDALVALQEIGEALGPLQEELTTLQQTVEPLALDELYAGLQDWVLRPPIIVETEREARLVPFEEVWPARMGDVAGAGPDPQRDYAGEQAVSSAILALVQQEKTGVVFVRYGGEPLLTPDFSQFNPMMGRLPTAPFQRLDEQLRRSNFVTAEWNVQETRQPPELPDAARVIYVVFPPESPPPDPMQPAPPPRITPEERPVILDAVEKSGMGVFMAGWQPPASPMMPMSTRYEFVDYLRGAWGIDVRYQYVAVAFAPSRQAPGRKVPAAPDMRMWALLTGEALRLTEHPIAAPLRGQNAGFFATCPVEVMTPAPEGVTVAPLVTVRQTEDIWAFDDLMRLRTELETRQGVLPAETDLRSPFPVAVAAQRGAQQRIVVFGSTRVASDDLTQAALTALTGRGLETYALYSANMDLFINTLHWLSDNADRIAVGPRLGTLPTLDRLTDGAATTFCRVFTVGIWPAAMLLAGGVVWLFRRR